MRYGHRAKLAQGDGITEMYEKTRAEGFGPEVRRRDHGRDLRAVGRASTTPTTTAPAGSARSSSATSTRPSRKGVDAILTPATPSAAFGLGEMASADPVQMYLNDVFTVTVNLAGLPGIAVPAGLDAQGLPLGLQLIGRPWEEGDLLNIAYALERAAGFAAKPARWW